MITYVTERDSTTLKIEQPSKGKYIVTPACSLDKNLFAGQLTAIIAEKDVKRVNIRQGNNKIKPEINQTQIIFEFDPFGGVVDIEIKK